MERQVKKIAEELKLIRKELVKMNKDKEEQVFTVVDLDDGLIASISTMDDQIICDDNFKVIVSNG